MDDQVRPHRQSGARGQDAAPTFREWWTEFTALRVSVRPSTLRRDASIFSCHLAPAFGDTPIDQIGFREAQRFVADLAGTDLAPRTVRKAAGLLSQALEIAVRSGVLEQNPARGLALPEVPHKEPRFLDPGEVERLAAAIRSPYRTLVLVGPTPASAMASSRPFVGNASTSQRPASMSQRPEPWAAMARRRLAHRSREPGAAPFRSPDS